MKTKVNTSLLILVFATALSACKNPPNIKEPQSVILPKATADSAAFAIFKENDVVIKIESEDTVSVKFLNGKFFKTTKPTLDTLLSSFIPKNPGVHYCVKASPDIATEKQIEVINILAKYKIFKVTLVTDTDTKQTN